MHLMNIRSKRKTLEIQTQKKSLKYMILFQRNVENNKLRKKL